ncbi:UDP-N-acetylmuramyl peptide synthase [Bifidobacterium simiarum]|uniref:UDP-N-acetylmuramyl peptide synthase n=1 Tax=Bifidobacterium simiarum TaxID=2045441 RepID=A0A2M9HH69_9BIFI|nr:UDP-N-acetylmuramyl peptide synthase [Bifidobacterium simiarum]MBT1165310.1 UDP-N-acetylmuramyl peptide synthase [Bifidobacterium simiarum]PJM76168.1 UDP-N-acetylmuramyl peptide synthase [Bifidobacterium simiarum]
MSALSEASTEHLTVSDLRERYGLLTDAKYAGRVTVTSIANDLKSVTPGALYMPSAGDVDEHSVEQAQLKGAYAVLLPTSARAMGLGGDIPVLYGDLTAEERGRIAADIAGHPSNSIAVFLIIGEQAAQQAAALAGLLHVLGNPVGQISYQHSKSLERHLIEEYPLNELDVQRMLSVFVEDGASAVIIGADDRALMPGALQSVVTDVCAVSEGDDPAAGTPALKEAMEHFGVALRERTHLAHRSSETDEMAAHRDADASDADRRRLSLAIAMVMKAGVRKGNIRSALRVSKEFD